MGYFFLVVLGVGFADGEAENFCTGFGVGVTASAGSKVGTAVA
jgi:hypothetical protein